MYAMMVGRLPFTTAYTDQYRRQKLFQQIEKGLTENHEKDMVHLTKGQSLVPGLYRTGLFSVL